MNTSFSQYIIGKLQSYDIYLLIGSGGKGGKIFDRMSLEPFTPVWSVAVHMWDSVADNFQDQTVNKREFHRLQNNVEKFSGWNNRPLYKVRFFCWNSKFQRAELDIRIDIAVPEWIG